MTERAKRNFLSHIQTYKLTQFLEAEYTKLGKSDREFADVATVALGFTVTEGNIHARRIALGIEATKDVLNKKNREKAEEIRQARLAKDRERKQASRANPPEFNYNEMIVQRLNAVIEKLDTLIRLWKE